MEQLFQVNEPNISLSVPVNGFIPLHDASVPPTNLKLGWDEMQTSCTAHQRAGLDARIRI
ncbi:hypothetical protein L873DRAFT_1803108 [Choiromyces venosus 120613-1]|uniref:Uncharacterized protein n=1 Tax=Choiromyces venosus 120613-1 TaxID=1336337 RepID=A0A3N4K099_9PEZI|nr:hypothetical protein L873DRAFT_1803108 [Choiromyces venosus 120613-1]